MTSTLPPGLRACAVTIAGSLMAVSLVGAAGTAATATGPSLEIVSASAKAKPRVTVTAAKKSVTEGDVLKLSAKVTQVRKAKRVTLQRWDKPYSWAAGRWTPVKSAKAKRKVTFRTTVTSVNRARYRVSVTYKGRNKPVVSKATAATVWRWIPLAAYTPYQSTTPLPTHAAAVNGRSYAVWGPYYYAQSAWESRYTTGRHCSAFRGAAGVKDSSGDGAVGVIEFEAEGKRLWTSPNLVPGRTVPFTVNLSPKPYRIALIARDTSGDASLRTLPVVVDPELYCTGV